MELNAGTSSWLLLEGGGSRTWVRSGDREVTAGSTSPASIGPTEAGARLEHLLRRAVPIRADVPRGLLAAHGAASTTVGAKSFAELLGEVVERLGIHTSIVVTNDIVPLLLAPAADSVLVAICGTGTGYAGKGSNGTMARAGGMEYVLSDEGGGYDIGMQALRAVVRSLDGRGPRTALTDRAADWVGAGERNLAESLSNHVYGPSLKPRVAEFASLVMAAAATGDDLAAGIVRRSAESILEGLRAVAEAVGASTEPAQIVLSGSLLTTDTPLRTATMANIDTTFTATVRVLEQHRNTAGLLRLAKAVETRDDMIRALSRAFPFARRG